MSAENEKLRLLMTGKMGSGKSLAAQYLEDNYHASRWSRTEMMKRLAHGVIDHLGSPDLILERIFSDPQTRDQVRQELFEYATAYQQEPSKPRRLYQDVTQICQDHDPLCFERELEERIRSLGEGGFSLIDDVRSKAAFDFFVEHGYKTLRIEASENVRRQRMLNRDGYLPADAAFNHPSETDLDEVPHQFIILNESNDSAPFFEQLDRLLQQLRKGEDDE